jgi:hypothetical protein
MALNGVFLAQIAQQSLPFLTNAFAPLRGITTDFSTDVASAGSSVTTRFATVPSVVDITSAGYAPVAGDTTARTISLDQHRGVTLGFTDIEVLQSSVNFRNLFLTPMLQALGADMFGQLWNLVTAANFAQTPLSSSAANFDRQDVIDLGVTLTQTLKAEGTVPRVSGFDIYESDLCDANSEALAGFALHSSALIMAARRVNPEAALQDSIEIAEVVVPDLGLPLTFRAYYNRELGQSCINVSCIWGVAKGTNMGVRIVTP